MTCEVGAKFGRAPVAFSGHQTSGKANKRRQNVRHATSTAALHDAAMEVAMAFGDEATSKLPCLACRHPAAETARAEIAAIYLAARAGRLLPSASRDALLPLPGPTSAAAFSARAHHGQTGDLRKLIGAADDSFAPIPSLNRKALTRRRTACIAN